MRLRRVFDAGLSEVTGYVLPIARERDLPMQPPKWVSGPWFFRDDRMYLIPGDSPMGYRLPLESLPWVSTGDYPYQHPHDPFAPPAPLRSAAELRMQYGGGTLAVAPGATGATGASWRRLRQQAALQPTAQARRQRPHPQQHPASRRAASLRRGFAARRCASRRATRRARPGRRSKRIRSAAASACCMCSCRR